MRPASPNKVASHYSNGLGPKTVSVFILITQTTTQSCNRSCNHVFKSLVLCCWDWDGLCHFTGYAFLSKHFETVLHYEDKVEAVAPQPKESRLDIETKLIGSLASTA